jgi:hypothetical protein
MVRHLLAAAIAAVLAAAPCGAATMTVERFDPATYLARVAGAAHVEDFEELGRQHGGGQLSSDEPLTTAIGTFVTLGGQGSGATSGGDGHALALRQGVQGQGNAIPFDGLWSLNSNDTFGLMWEATWPSAFNWLALVLIDAADTRNVVVDIVLRGGPSMRVSDQPDGGKLLVTVVFDRPVYSAALWISNSRNGRPATNDSFSIDGVALGLAPAVVPLPPSGWLLGGALGAAAMVVRWRRGGRTGRRSSA